MDIVSKLEKAVRARHRVLKTELSNIEHLIAAFERSVKSGAKRTGRNRISAAGRRRISMAQKARWAKSRKR